MKKSVLAACLGWMFSAVDIILLILFQNEVATGLGTSAELADAEDAVTEAEGAITDAEHDLARARATLGNLLGRQPVNP